MKKAVILILIGTSVMFRLSAHVDLTNPEGGETFDAGNQVTVSWVETVSHNTLNWDLLFSSDGGSSWDTIQADIPLETLRYTWTVPAISTVQGRIRIVQDNDNTDYYGTSDNFNIVSATGISDPQSIVQLGIYPNPLVDITSITFENPGHLTHTLSIYNTRGNIVRTIPHITSGLVKVERKNLGAGLYFLLLRDEDELRARGKLMVK